MRSLLQQSNILQDHIIMTKAAYDLSLQYKSRKSYKLFYNFEQQQIRDDNIHLASDYDHKCLL